jgi:hypothetical protein
MDSEAMQTETELSARPQHYFSLSLFPPFGDLKFISDYP